MSRRSRTNPWTAIARPLCAAASLAGAASAQLIVGVQTNSPQAMVWRIDVATGQRDPLFQGSSSALAVDDANGIVYSADLTKLWKWNYGGGPTATLLGVVHVASGQPLSIVGMAYGGGRLFGTSWAFTPGQDWLFEINPSTLLATPIPMPQQLNWVEGLSYEASSGLFYAANDVGGANDQLYRIDILNGGAPLLLGQLAGDADSAAIGAGGLIYIVPDNGSAFSIYDLATSQYQYNAIWCPFAVGNDESASEWAPSLPAATGPSVYCQPGGPAGCKVLVSSTGSPSASAGSGFLVQHSQIRAGSRTQLHYSFAGPMQAPFGGAWRCIRPPVFRLPPTYVQNGVGCLSVSRDFNAYIASGANPALVAGQTVWMQLAAQTPVLEAQGQFDLSPGLTFTIGP